MRLTFPLVRALLALLICGFLCGGTLRAQTTYTWNGTTTGNWSAAGSWANSFQPTSAGTVSDIVSFTGNASYTSTLNNGGVQQVGELLFSNTLGTVTLNPNTVETFTLNSATSISLTATGSAVISVPLKLGQTSAFSNTGTGTLTILGTVNNGGFLLTSTGTGSTTISGVIGGAGGLTKSGTGTLTLSGANTYTGATTISAGIVNYQNAAAFGGTSAITVASAATAQIQGGLIGGSSALTISGVGASAATGALESVSGANSYPGLLTLGAAATISVDAGSLSLTNAGTITGAGFTLTLSGAGNGSIASPIGTTTGGLTKSGTGTWSLTGTSTFTGATTINAGTLQIGSAGSLNSGVYAGAITNNGTLQYSSSTTQTLSGAITGTGNLIKDANSSSFLFLSGTNTFSGGTTVSSGTLIANSISAVGTGGLTVDSGATFAYRPAAAGGLSLGSGVLTLNNGSTIGTALGGAAAGLSAINSSAAASLSGTGTVNIYGILGVAPTAGTNNLIAAASGLDGGTFNLGNIYNAINFTVSGYAQSPTAISVNVATATALSSEFWMGGFSGGNNVWALSDGTANSNWAISQTGGTTSLTPGPTATITFSANSAVNQGAMVLGASMSVLGIVVNDAAPIALNADSNSLTIGAGGISINNTSGNPSVTLGAPIVLGGAQSWTNNSTNALIVSGVISGNGALTTAGTGTVIFTGANTYTGTTTIAAGTLQIGNGGATGTLGTGNVTVTSPGSLVFNRSDAAYTYAGIISGTGGVTMAGSGTITLGGLNTFTGGTIVNSGSLTLASAAGTGIIRGSLTINSGSTVNASNTWAMGYTSAAVSVTSIVINSGTLNFTGTADNGGLAANSITITGSTISGTVFDWYGGGANQSINPTLTTNASSTTSLISTGINLRLGANTDFLTFNVAQGTTASGVDLLVSGPITQTGSGSIIKTGAGMAILSGTNTFTGTTTVNNGILQIGAGGATGTLGTGAVTITSPGMLVFNRSDAALTVASVISGTGSLTQAGTGTLTLSAINTYTGATNVAAGKLLVTSSLLTTSGIAVSSGAILGGTGSVGPTTLAANAILQAGGANGSGTLTLASLTFNGAGSVNFGTLSNYSAVNGIAISSGGLLTPGNSSNSITINVANLTGTTVGNTYNLIGYTGTIGGAGFGAFQLGNLPGRQTGTLINNTTTTPNQIQLQITGAALPLIWSGTGNLTNGWDTATQNWTLGSGGAATAFINNLGDIVVFDDTASSSNTTVNINSGNVTPSSVTFNNTVNNYTLQGSNGIAGTAGLTKNNAGTLTISTANTYTGTTTLAGGIVNLGAAQNGTTSGPLGVSGAIVFSGGTLQYSASNQFDYSSRFVTTASQVYSVDTNNQSATWATALTSSGGSLVKTGAGTLTLTATETYTGGTIVNAGTLTLAQQITAGTGIIRGTLTINSGATVNANNNWSFGYTSAALAVTSITINSGTLNFYGTASLGGGLSATGITMTGSTISGNPFDWYNSQTVNPTLTTNASSTTSIISGGINLRLGANTDNLTLNVARGTTANGVDLLFTASITQTGSGSITKTGPGTAVFQAANTYTGTTSVNNGILQIGAGGTTGSVGTGAIIITSPGTLAYNRSDASLTIGSTISGTGSLTQAGSGTLILSGTTTAFTGTATVASGTLIVNSNLGAATVNVNGGGTLGGTGSAGATTLAANGIVQPGVNGSGQLTLASLTASGAGSINIGTLSNYSATSGGILVTGELTLNGSANSILINVASLGTATNGNTYQLISYGTLGGSGFGAFQLAPLPSRTVATLVNNTASNEIDLSITGGTDFLVWTGVGNLTSGWNTTTPNWKLNSSGAATTFINNPGDAVVFDDSASASNTTVNINSANVTPSNVTFNNTVNNYTLQGSNGIAGITALTMNGTATLTIKTANTYTGITTLNAGTVNVGAAQTAASGPLGASGSIVFAGGTLQYSASNQYDYSSWFSAAANQAYSVDTNGQSVTWASPLTSPGGTLTVSDSHGGGTLNLNGTNTYTGGTIVNSGTLTLPAVPIGLPASGTGIINGSLTINSGATVNANTQWSLGYTSTAVSVTSIVINGGTLNFYTTAGAGGTAANSITMTGGTISGSPFDWYVGSANQSLNPTLTTNASSTIAVISGGINLRLSSNVNALTLNVAQGTTSSGVDLLISGPITNSGSGSIIVAGPGTTVFNGTNTYTGTTTINGGVLQIGAGGTSGTLGTGAVTINSPGTLVFNRSDASLTIGNAISGSGSFTQAGSGTLILSSSVSYTGTTTVAGGTLLVNSNLASSNANVSGGATLGGSGSIGAATVAANGGIQAGASSASPFALAGLAFNGAGSVGFGTLSNYPAGTPGIAVSGTLSTTGNNSIQINIASVAGTSTGTTYGLIGYSGTIGGAGFAAFQLGTLPGRARGILVDNPNEIDLQITGTDFLVWTGASNLTNGWNTTTPNWKLNSSGTPTTYINNPGDNVVFDDSASPGNTSVFLNSGNVNPTSVTFNNSVNNYTLTGGSAIAGGTGITMNGTGTVALLLSNTYTGVTTLNAGIVNVGVAQNGTTSGPLGAAGPIVFAGGTLQYSASNQFDYSGRFSTAAGQAYSVDTYGQSVTWASALTSSGGSLTVADSQGGGTLNLTATETYTGGTIVNSGTLTLPQQITTGTGIIRGSLTINNGATVNANINWSFGYTSAALAVTSIVINGGTLNYYGTATSGGTSASSITMTGGTISGVIFDWYNSQTTNPTLSTNASSTTAVISDGFNLRLGNNGYALTLNIAQGTAPAGVDLLVSGPITNSGSGSIIMAGPGTVVFTGANTYTGTTTINGGLLQIGSGGTIGAIGTGAVTINSPGTLAFNRSDNVVFAPVGGIGGSGTLAQMGPGVLTVPGTNPFSGNLSVSGGTLRLQAGGFSTLGAVSVNGGTTLSTYGITPATSTSSLSTLALGTTTAATLGFEFNGVPTTAPLTVTTPDGIALNGTTIVNISNIQGTPVGEIPLIAYSGTAITSGFAIGTLPTARTIANIDYSVAGLIQLNVVASAIKWTGSINTTWDAGTAINTGGTFNWTFNNASTNFFTRDAVIFDDTAAAGGGTGPVAVSLGAAVSPSSVTFANSAARSYTLSGAGSIAGTGSLSIANGGTVAIATANTYSGGTFLISGQLNINLGGTTSSAIGTGPLTISAGTTIDNTSGLPVALGTNNTQLWNGNFTFGGTNPLDLGMGTVLLGSSLTLMANGTSPLTVGGSISDGGLAYSLTNGGTGTLVLAGANTFSGGVILNSGTLSLNNAAALGTGPLTINGGSLDNTSAAAITLATNNVQTWNGNFTFNGTQSLNLGTGAVTLTNSVQVTVNANTLTVGAVNGIGFGLTKNGAGTLVLNTNEPYTGPTVINSGILQVNGTNNATSGIYNSGVITVNSGGTLMTGINNNGLVGYYNACTITINTGGTLTSPSGATTTTHVQTVDLYGGTLAFAGTISGSALTYGTYNLDQGINAGGSNATGTSTISAAGVALTQTGGTIFNVNPAAIQTIPGVDLDVTGSFAQPTGVTNTGLIKTGSGVMRLDGSNTFTSGMTINAGTLSVSSDANLGTSAGSLSFGGGTLEVTGTTYTALPSARALNWLPGGGGFNIASAANTFTVSQSLIDPGFPAPLTKLGAGTLVLTGANTYTSGTTVLTGTLSVNSDSALGNPTGAVSIDVFGTLTFSAPTTTSRTFGPLASSSVGGTLDSNTQTVTLNGASIGSLFLTGPGVTIPTTGTGVGIPVPNAGSFSTFADAAGAPATGVAFNGTITHPNAVIISNSNSDTFTNVKNGGYLYVSPGLNNVGTTTGVNFTNLLVQGSGAVVVGNNSSINVNGLNSYGFLQLIADPNHGQTNPPLLGGTLTNTGSTDLQFLAGSVTRIGDPSDDATTAQTTTVNLNGHNLVVTGGLFVNNGFVGDLSGGTGVVYANTGSLVKGGGTYLNSVQTVGTPPGVFYPGNSIGRGTIVNATFGPGGTTNMGFQISDVNGPSGGAPAGSPTGTPTSGFGLVNVSNSLAWTATATNKLTVQMQSLLNNDVVGGPDNAGPVYNFNNTQSYTWPLIKWTTGYLASNPQTSQALNATVNIDSATAFANVNPLNGGTFSVVLSGNTVGTGPGEIDIVFTPAATPEPATVLGLAAVGLGLARVVGRRRN